MVHAELWRKRHREGVRKGHSNKGVQPILPTEPIRSINEVLKLFVQHLHLRWRQQVYFPHIFRQFLNSPSNLFLLFRSERRILGDRVGAGSEQLRLALKLSP